METTKTFRHYLAESEKVRRDYSSVQLHLPEKLADEIISWGYDHVPERLIFFNPNRPSFGREDNIHITILYGIKEKLSVVASLLKNIKPFEVELGKTSLFQNEVFDVLKIDVECAELHHINSILTKNLEVFQTYPKYIPHVTIAYLNKNRGREYKNRNDFEGITFKVNEFVFSSKDGPKYKIELGENDA